MPKRISKKHATLAYYIARDGRPGYQIAVAANMSPSKLSQIVSGVLPLSDEDAEVIGKAMKVPAEHLQQSVPVEM